MTNQNGSKDETSTGFVLSPKWYNRMKWFTIICIPALSAFYSGMAGLWGFPYAVQIVGSLGLLGVLLGATLGISNRNYNKQDHDGSVTARIEGDTVILGTLKLPDVAPEDLPYMKTLTVKINPDRNSQ